MEDMQAIKIIEEEKRGRLFTLDGSLTIDEMTKQMREYLGLDLMGLDWDYRVLQKVHQSSIKLNIPCWIIGGGVSRVFWNDTFGPNQKSLDIDIISLFKEDAHILEQDLCQSHPHLRWSVHGSTNKEHYNATKDPQEELKRLVTNMSLSFRCSGVRLTTTDTNPQQLEILLGEGVEGDLRKGILRYRKGSLVGFPSYLMKKIRAECTNRTRKYLEEYPGLSLSGLLKVIHILHYSKAHMWLGSF
eukprot:TRINITY_DN4647_c0_g2_i2.p1 TRINITY_DN4647_c0_g2~~TRINITY_DN4647_c0_g2_i2.p1  ORF type:complete len:256 (+),score=39.78 TRINITY_DN4647_c0_g2_i2:37-768(+)